jgi:hypothetical protein
VHLYQGTSEQFIADAVQARFANQLADRFFDEFRYRQVEDSIVLWDDIRLRVEYDYVREARSVRRSDAKAPDPR